MIDLTGKTFCTLGLKGTGKSTLNDMLRAQYGARALYYDTLHESPSNTEYDVYQPQNKYSVVELEAVIKAITPETRFATPKYRLFVIDEANRFCPPYPRPLPAGVRDLNDICRHYGMTVGFIARRPTQLHADLVDMAEYLFVFRLTGKNDMKYLENTVSGLADAVRSLGDFEFVLVHPDKSFEVCEPIQPTEIWINQAKHLIRT